jgi:hypothetical protein
MPNQHDREARPGNVHRLRKLTGAAAQATNREYPYTEQEVAESLAVVAEVGRAEAARQLGISETMLAAWEDKASRDLRAARSAYLASGGSLAEGEDPPDWRTQREQEANRAGLDACIVRDRATQAMLDGNDRLVRAGAAYYAALIDRAQMLTAGARPTPQTPEEKRERVRRIVANWKREAEAQGNTAAAELFETRLRALGSDQLA